MRSIFDVQAIESEAAELDLNPATLEKTYRLLTVLNEIGSHNLLSQVLALKGGTAINLFNSDPKRMSVDLDFNYVGAVSLQETQVDRPKIVAQLKRIAESHSYQVQSSPGGHAGQTIHLNYRNVLRETDRIEVDISYTNRVPLLPLERKIAWSPKHANNKPALICSREELIAGKMRALMNRTAARDVFDAAWVMELIPEEEFHLFKRIFTLFASTLPKPLYEYTADRVYDLTEHDVQTRLLPMMRLSTKVDREQLIAKAKSAVEPLLQLDESEKEFCHRIDHGEYLPELILSEWPDIMEPLREHPALLWKAENAGKHRS